MKILPITTSKFNQQSTINNQTNPSFGINKTKAIMFPLGIGAGVLGASAQKLMPVQSDTALASQNGPTPQKQVQKYRDLPAIDKDGNTRLHYLFRSGKLEDLQEFLEKNPDINLNQRNKRGETAVYLAINSGKREIVNWIAYTDNNYDPTIPDKYGYTDLHSLCYNGYSYAVDAFCEKNPNIDFNQQTKSGTTCMFNAQSQNHTDLVEFIANRDNYNPTIPIPGKHNLTDLYNLMDSEKYQYVAVNLCKKLPDFDFNIQNEDRETYMYIAIYSKNNDLVNFIANSKNYDPTIPHRNGCTDLHTLSNEGCIDALQTLCKLHPNIDFNQQDDFGQTCMGMALYSRRNEQNHRKRENLDKTINFIANRENYNPTIPNKSGFTDLHILCRYGYIDIYEALVKKHPEFDIDQKDASGYSCRMYVEEYYKRLNDSQNSVI